MLDWINHKYNINLTDADLLEIKNFTLLWNIYENTVFNNSFSINRLQEQIANRNLELNSFNGVLTYFRNRYTTNGETNHRFAHLNLRQIDRPDIVSSCLLGTNDNPQNKILAIGIIVYRYRCNLFHGLKDFMVIGEQQENFRNANIYLQTFLT